MSWIESPYQSGIDGSVKKIRLNSKYVSTAILESDPAINSFYLRIRLNDGSKLSWVYDNEPDLISAYNKFKDSQK